MTHYRLHAAAPVTLCRQSGNDSTDITRVTCDLCRDLCRVLGELKAQHQTETIDRLYLELSQFTNATSFRELAYQREILRLHEAMQDADGRVAERIATWIDELAAEVRPGDTEDYKLAGDNCRQLARLVRAGVWRKS